MIKFKLENVDGSILYEEAVSECATTDVSRLHDHYAFIDRISDLESKYSVTLEVIGRDRIEYYIVYDVLVFYSHGRLDFEKIQTFCSELRTLIGESLKEIHLEQLTR